VIQRPSAPSSHSWPSRTCRCNLGRRWRRVSVRCGKDAIRLCVVRGGTADDTVEVAELEMSTASSVGQTSGTLRLHTHSHCRRPSWRSRSRDVLQWPSAESKHSLPSRTCGCSPSSRRRRVSVRCIECVISLCMVRGGAAGGYIKRRRLSL
jgi:hypothetical protein